MRFCTLGVGLAIVLFAVSAVPAGAAPVSFDNKTIRVIVPYPAGGGVDAMARLLANHIGKYLTGDPTIIVENMPGAGGARAANYLYNVAPKDGTAFAVTIAPFTTEFIGRKGIRFKSANFQWIGALNISQVTFVRKSVGIAFAAELMKTEKELVIGGLRPSAARDLRMRAFLEAMGVKDYKYVSGYRGTAPVRQAFLRGEVNFSDEAVGAVVTALRAALEDGTVVPLVQTGLTREGKRTRDPRMADVPLAEDTVVKLRGEAVTKSVEYRGLRAIIQMVALGRAIFLPPGVSPEVVGTWRDVIAKVNTDPEFQRKAAKQTGGAKMLLTGGAEAQALAQKITETMGKDPETIGYLQKLAKRK